MTRPSGLTSQEKVILHLFALRDSHIDVDAPYAATREGIARALNMRTTHVTREIKALESTGHISWKTTHVLGFRKRVRIYNLTADGLKRAEGIIQSIRDIPIVLSDEFGGVQTLPLKRAYMQSRGKRSYLDLLRTRDTGEALGPDAAQVFASTRASEFFGRNEELSSMARWLSSDPSSVLVVYGIAGIGKTALVMNFARRVEDRPRFYVKINEWDSVRGIMESMASAFIGMGDERLSAQFKGNIREDMSNFYLTLKAALKNISPLLVFDDLWLASDELWKVLMLIHDAVSESKAKLVFISREFPRHLEGAPEAKHSVSRLKLDGLKDKEARMLLESREILKESDKKMDELIDSLHGHPLLLRMVTGIEDSRVLLEGEVSRFIHKEVYSHLSKGEKIVLQTLAVLRHPIEGSYVVRKFGYEIMSSLGRKSLIESIGIRVTLHDLIRAFLMLVISTEELMSAHITARDILPPFGQHIIERAYHSKCAGKTEAAARELISSGDRLIESGSSEEVLRLLGDTGSMELPGDVGDATRLLRMKCLYQIGRFGPVIGTYKEGCRVLSSSKEETLIAGSAYIELGNAKGALAAFARLKKKRLDPELTIQLNQGLARHADLLGRYCVARRLSLKVLETARRLGKDVLVGVVLMDLGANAIYRGNVKEATRYYLDAMRYVRKDERLLARLYMGLSVSYDLRSLSELAIDMIDKAETLYRKSCNYDLMLKCMVNRSTYLVHQEKYMEAEETLLRLREIAESGRIDRYGAFALVNLSSIYLSTKRYDKAKAAAEEAFSFLKRTDDIRSMIAARNNLGFALVMMGQCKKGLRILKDSRMSSMRTGSDHLIIDSTFFLAKGYHIAGLKNKAMQLCREALHIAKEKGITSIVREIETFMKERSSHT